MIVRIPPDSLSKEALYGLIEEFVTRDGTDYGEHEMSLQQKTDQVQQLLARGELVIVYSDVDERCNFLSINDYESRLKASQ